MNRFYIGSDGKADSISGAAASFTYQGQSLCRDEDAVAARPGNNRQNPGGAGDAFQFVVILQNYRERGAILWKQEMCW